MPLHFGFNVVEGKVYRGKKRTEEDDEKQALRELQTILGSKNRKACDCEAQVHDLLENCLNCGRLACEAEGPGKCFSCDNLMLTSEQRERFKKHIDMLQPVQTTSMQPSGSRTRIIDDQFDHFTIDNKKHLREQDKRRLRDNLEELQAQRYQRKLVLEVDVDQLTAGSRSTPKVDDYEAALRDLQLNSCISGSESKFTLAELIQRESKCNYNLEYVEPQKSTPNVAQNAKPREKKSKPRK